MTHLPVEMKLSVWNGDKSRKGLTAVVDKLRRPCDTKIAVLGKQPMLRLQQSPIVKQ
jgi:hypothetical protein